MSVHTVVHSSAKLVIKTLTGPAVGGGGSGSSGAGSWIYVYDVIGQGAVVTSGKTYQDTGNNILESFDTSASGITLRVRASHPLVTLDGNTTMLPKVGDIFDGDINYSLAASGNLTVRVQDGNGEDGATHTIAGSLEAPPTILTLEFTGGYPGAQTELKAGDTFQLSGTTDKAADAIEVQDFEASDSVQELTFASATSFTVTMTIGDRGDVAQALSARVRARDAVSGAYGATFDTTNTVTLNNLAPTVSIGAITYPATQGALKNAESATVVNTASDYDTIAYSDPTSSELSISNPSTFENPKSVSRSGGSFNNSSTNFRITATRAANGAVTVANDTVIIANVAPTISISTPAARLRSGGNNGTSPQDYTITISSDQPLASAPTLNADGGGNRGTFQGSWAGSAATWTRDLRVDETVPDEKGTFSFEGLVATGLSGLTQNTIGSGAAYTLGGFVARTLNFAAFTANSTESVVISDQSKLSAGSFSNGNASVRQAAGTADTTTVGQEGWYAPTAASGTAQLRMLHSPTVSANSLGVTLPDVEETV